MEAVTDCLGLSEQNLFKIVREGLPSLDLKTRNIVEFQEDILFVWDCKGNCLLTINLKTSLDSHVSNQSYQVWTLRSISSSCYYILGSCIY